jgi:hypothetical protein
MEISMTEYGKQNDMTDDELVDYFSKELHMPKEDIWLMLAIERGEVDGDVIEGE